MTGRPLTVEVLDTPRPWWDSSAFEAEFGVSPTPLVEALRERSSGMPHSMDRQNRRHIGRLHQVVIDCPDPAHLAAFYSELIGLPVTFANDDWVVIAEDNTTSGIAFQRAPDHQPPQWPDPDRPQQFHLDVMVDDVGAAERRVVDLGAQRLPAGDAVYADPAGHPFCLIPRPRWAPPISGS